MAVRVTCRVIFTFGGLAIRSNPQISAVISSLKSKAVPGVYSAGRWLDVSSTESLSYPRGNGLPSGATSAGKAGVYAMIR